MVPNAAPVSRLRVRSPVRDWFKMLRNIWRLAAVTLLLLTAPAATAQTAGPVLRRVAVNPGVASAVSDRLNLHYQGSGAVTVAVDPARGDRLMVMAPAAQQETIAQEVEHLAGHLLAAGSAPGGLTVPLRSITWREFEDALRLVAGPSAAVTTSRNGERASIPVADASGKASVRVDVDRRQNTVTIHCREDQTVGWRKLLEAIDAPMPAGTTLHVHRVIHAEFAPIQRAVRLLRTPAAENPRTAWRRSQSKVRQVAFQDAQAGDGAGGNDAGEASDDAAAGGLIGDTDVQFIPESGLIIIRGNRRDVDRIRDVIGEIEKQSELTRPEVRLRQLEYADSSAVAALLTQLYDDVLSARQGDVSITALDTPNALLLIGRAEAVAAVLDLIDKIDQPVAESDRLRVFRLQHASAVDAEETIREFFTARPGSDDEFRPALGPRVRVTADYRTNSLIVSAAPRDIEEVTRLIENLDVVDVPSTSEIRVFQLLNSEAESLQEVLQSALAEAAEDAGEGETTPPSATLSIGGAAGQTLRSGVLAGIVITADPSANAIVVRGPAAGMPLVAELIRQLDQTSGVESLVKVFTVQNGDAAQLTTALQTLFGENAATEGTSVGAANAAGLTPATAAESALVPLRFSTDVRTNSIIASGSAEDLEVVESILLRLDSSGFAERITEVIWLRHQAAANIATAIQEYVAQRLQSQSQIPQLQTGLGVLDLPDRDIIAVPEIQTNSLLISVSPRLYEEVRRLIDRLDRRPPMVLIKTLIAEVSLTDGFEIGGQFGLQDSILFDRGKASGALAQTNPPSTNAALPQVVTTQANGTVQVSNNVSVEQLGALNNFLRSVGFNFAGTSLNNANSASQGNLASQGRTEFGVGTTTLLGSAFGGLGAGQGFVFSAASESVSLLLRALRAANRLQILSRPEVMTADNTEGLVTVGQLFPRPTALSFNQFGGTQVGVEDINIGLILRVRPRVGSDGLILMDIDATRSGVSNSVPGQTIGVLENGQPLIVPAIDQTVAQSTITAFDGQTVVFGGLIQKQRQNISRKVPYLADIPYLGVFFKYEGETEIRNELLVVMTPSLITGDEDLEYVKQSESSRMSWCLADVVEAHGDVGLSGGYGLWGPAIGPTIYPDLHPTADVFPPADLPHGPRAVHPNNPRYGQVLEAMLASPELIEAPPVLFPAAPPVFEAPIHLMPQDLPPPPVQVAPPEVEVTPLPPPASVQPDPLPPLQLEIEPAAHKRSRWFGFKPPRDA